MAAQSHVAISAADILARINDFDVG
jgi:hypothetical protein